MPFLSQLEVRSRLKQNATNSSHFVWLLSDARFFETSNGWVFAYQTVSSITLVALEPLIPGAPTRYDNIHHAEFAVAWREFVEAAEVKTAMFISVYRPFLEILARADFTTLKVGQEPWVNLDNCIPTGNSGKGVRAARNQALRAGITVEEWNGEELVADPAKRKVLADILDEWKSARLLDVSGFLDKIDPFAFASDRRYFIVRSPRRIEAFLVASPIAGIQSYFLEDLIIRKNAPNGCGELVTLEAMVALGNSGQKTASLGVVALNSLGSDRHDTIPPKFKTVLRGFSRAARLVYNTDGMEMYRRRFKPHHWSSIHLAVNSDRGGEWLKAIGALLYIFRPRLRPTFAWFRNLIERPLRRYPITICVAVISIICFWQANHFGDLPEKLLSRFGFIANADPIEWPIRSITSDFLYFNLHHFLCWGGLLLVVLSWTERKHSFYFLIIFFATCSLLDDFINYWLVIMPFQYFQPKIFNRLVVYKDVGSSLQLMALLGLQLRQFKVFREPLFAFFSLVLVFLFLFPAGRLDNYIVNLNHFLFFTGGYVVGVIKFEWERMQSRKTSKLKPPVANSVLRRTPA